MQAYIAFFLMEREMMYFTHPHTPTHTCTHKIVPFLEIQLQKHLSSLIAHNTRSLGASKITCGLNSRITTTLNTYNDILNIPPNHIMITSF